MESIFKKQGAVNAKSNTAQDLRGLFEVGLKDIYRAEKTLSKTLPKMVKKASSPELVNALKSHLNDVEEHVSRLEKLFETTGIKADAKKCVAMEGLLKESNGIMDETERGVVRDAGIIASGQKMKHYEIASYGTLHAFAKTLGENNAEKLLAMSLNEEKKADATLTGIAISAINTRAAVANVRL